jgi:hypothetical protein
MWEIERDAPTHDGQNETVRLRYRDGHELEILQVFHAQSPSGFTSTKVQILTMWRAFQTVGRDAEPAFRRDSQPHS